jgi:hypothetical protein
VPRPVDGPETTRAGVDDDWLKTAIVLDALLAA